MRRLCTLAARLRTRSSDPAPNSVGVVRVEARAARLEQIDLLGPLDEPLGSLTKPLEPVVISPEQIDLLGPSEELLGSLVEHLEPTVVSQVAIAVSPVAINLVAVSWVAVNLVAIDLLGPVVSGSGEPKVLGLTAGYMHG